VTEDLGNFRFIASRRLVGPRRLSVQCVGQCLSGRTRHRVKMTAPLRLVQSLVIRGAVPTLRHTSAWYAGTTSVSP